MPRILHLRLWQRWKVGQWRWPSPNNAKCLSPKNAAKQTFTASDAIFSSVSLRKTPKILCTRLKNNAKECRKTQNAQVFLVKSHRGERFVTNKAKRAQQQYKRARRNNSRHSRLQLVVVEGDLLEIVVQVGKKRTDNFDEGWPHGGAVVPAHQHQVVPVGVETKTRLKTSIASPPLLPFLHATHAAQASICSKPMPFCKNFILVTATERSRSAAAIHSVAAERSLGKSVHLNCPPGKKQHQGFSLPPIAPTKSNCATVTTGHVTKQQRRVITVIYLRQNRLNRSIKKTTQICDGFSGKEECLFARSGWANFRGKTWVEKTH